MAKVLLAVCKCCALGDPAIAAAVERIEAEYGDQVTVTAPRCLDVCLENGAVKINGEIMTLRSDEAPLLEAKVAAAVRG
jgi:hypothetical protein